MKIFQTEFSLGAKKRGFNLVTREIEEQISEMKEISKGIAHIFILHTSASLTINENADPDVRGDMERHFNKLAPENESHYEHTSEGPDDMPAHIKATLLGSGITVPITNGEFNLGTWQGIYLNEHRNHGGKRKIVVTMFGE